MNIHAKENDKVIFTGENADSLEVNHAFKILEVGKEYIVFYTNPHEYLGGTVCLKGYTAYDFDMNMFEDIEEG